MKQAEGDCVQDVIPLSQCCVQREAAACSGADTQCCFMFDIYRCGHLNLKGPKYRLLSQQYRSKVELGNTCTREAHTDKIYVLEEVKEIFQQDGDGLN